MGATMLDFKIYKYPMFALSSAISIVLSVSMFSRMFLTPVYVQTIRELSPIDSGLLMLPGAIVMWLMSPITGRLFDKYGARNMALIGLSITIITTYFLSQLQMDTGYYYLMTIYTIWMIGISMVMMPVMTNGLNQLPMISNPHGTAMNSTLQQVSGAIGSAVLLTVMTKRSASAGKELMGTVDPSTTAKELANLAMLDGINFAFFISTLVALDRKSTRLNSSHVAISYA